jgi:hypothetical protein
MMQSISFTEPVVRSAARRGVLRMLGPLFFVAIGLMGAWVAFEVVQGDLDWSFGVAVTVLVLALIVPVAAIRAHTRFAVEKFRALDEGAASIDLSDGRLRAVSKIGSLDLPLSTVKKVWRYPDYWILVGSRSILMTVPLRGLTPDVTSAWEAELKIAGAKL